MPLDNNDPATDSDKFIEEVDAELRATRASEDQVLLAAKTNAPATKAKFDVNELLKYYSHSSRYLRRDIQISVEHIREMEMVYYIEYPELNSMQELAEKLNWMDINDVG